MLRNIKEPLEPLNPQKIAIAEKALGVKFPDGYVGFLLKYNGGRPEPAGFDIDWKIIKKSVNIGEHHCFPGSFPSMMVKQPIYCETTK